MESSKPDQDSLFSSAAKPGKKYAFTERQLSKSYDFIFESNPPSRSGSNSSMQDEREVKDVM